MQDSEVERAKNVALHYNARPELGREDRKRSDVFQLKALNNWIKSVLIAEATSETRATRVLDLCCGKGGDLVKWSKAPTIQSLVGVDIADVSVEQATKRFKDMRFVNYKANFLAADVFATPLEPLIPSFRGTFDVVSCQFALHYSFETETRARQGLQNISLALRDGGLFFGTLPHANWIVKKLRSIEGLSFGNPLYSISFEQKEDYPLFGHTYKFALLDAIDDCPEYLVHFPTLKRLASEYGLECVAAHPFHDFVYDKMKDPRHARLMETMQVFDANGQFSPDCWEVAGLYMTFVFKKMRTS